MALDLTEAKDRVRLAVADTQDIPIFPDDVYEYLLTKHDNNETAATKEAAYLILGQLSYNTHERLDRLEFFGNQSFEQYRLFIQDVIRNPSGALALAGIYVAGLDLAEAIANDEDTTIVHHFLPSYANQIEPDIDSTNYF